MRKYTQEEIAELNEDELIDALVSTERLKPVSLRKNGEYPMQEQSNTLIREITTRAVNSLQT